jgi:geranylgeranyl pyrophosphate synthase
MLKTVRFDLVEADLKRVEAKMREGSADHHEALTTTIDYLISAGGKRLRPMITLLASRFGRSQRERAIALAAAVEMLHTARLLDPSNFCYTLRAKKNPSSATINTNWRKNKR